MQPLLARFDAKVFWFCIFLIIAAPIEIVLDLWGGFAEPDAKMLFAPLTHALLYLYAFVVSVEALFRLVQHQDKVRRRPQMHIIMFLAGIVIVFFVVDYVAVLRPEVWHHETVQGSWWRQVPAVMFAIIASLLAFSLTQRDQNAGADLENAKAARSDTVEH